MKLLTRKDEMMLLAILRLDEEAALISLRELLNAQTGKSWSVGNVFVSLEKLENLTYIHSSLGAPSAKRGGRAVKFYKVTPVGLKALKDARLMQENLWDGLQDMVLKA
ncbi:PadR family transcriptional regulator [bacterium]|nr:PadR family transcriptional regulator [bacterium]